MGGSGGGLLGNIDPEEYIKKVRIAEQRSTSSEFNTEVNRIINDVLLSANDRPIDDIKRHLEVIIDALSKDIDNSIELLYAGSVAKHTYVNGLSDIDSLAIINNTELKNKSPKEVLDYFYFKLKERLPNTEVKVGRLAVTIIYSNNIQIQILPTLKTLTGIKIAKSNGENDWSTVIKPDKFAQKLKEVNSLNAQKVVPIIKLAKSIISDLPEKRQVSGYHAESLAIEAFENYQGLKTPKEMLKHFFIESSKRILEPIKDNTGQSVHVDDYLGERNSVSRQIISDSFAQIVRKMQNADGSTQIELWKSLLK